MGANENNAHLYLLDFGLAKKYRSSRTLIQYPLIKKKKLSGTAIYGLIHALEELEQRRRDNLESVGYVLIYFLRGGLPWQGLKIRSKEDRYKKILVKKRNFKWRILQGISWRISGICRINKKFRIWWTTWLWYANK